MKASISWPQSVLNFFRNRILICYNCSQIFKLFHPLESTITHPNTVNSSCILNSTHDHVLSFISTYCTSPVPNISLFVGCLMATGTVYLCMGYIQIMWKPNGIMRACTDAGVFPLVVIFLWHRSDSWRSREGRVHVDHLHLYHLRCSHCDKLQGDTATPSGVSRAGTWGSPE